MKAQPTEERQVVWEVLAQLWVDTWYDAGELDPFADRLAGCGFSIPELDRIAYGEVCGAFALFTLRVFFTMFLRDTWSNLRSRVARRLVATAGQDGVARG